MTNLDFILQAKTEQEVKDFLFEFETELRYTKGVNYDKWLKKERDITSTIGKGLAVFLKELAEGNNE